MRRGIAGSSRHDPSSSGGRAMRPPCPRWGGGHWRPFPRQGHQYQGHAAAGGGARSQLACSCTGVWSARFFFLCFIVFRASGRLPGLGWGECAFRSPRGRAALCRINGGGPLARPRRAVPAWIRRAPGRRAPAGCGAPHPPRPMRPQRSRRRRRHPGSAVGGGAAAAAAGVRRPTAHVLAGCCGPAPPAAGHGACVGGRPCCPPCRRTPNGGVGMSPKRLMVRCDVPAVQPLCFYLLLFFFFRCLTIPRPPARPRTRQLPRVCTRYRQGPAAMMNQEL